MATLLTVNTNPLAINPAYREVLWNLTSTDPNIKAVRGDVYVNGSYLTTIDGVQELGSTDTFDFDIRKIMQAQLVSELRTNITTLACTDAVTSAATVKMRFFEIIESGGVHTHTWLADGAGTNYLEDGDYDVVNMATQHQDTLSDWTVDSASKLLLTQRSDNNSIPKGVPFQVGFLTSDTSLKVNVLELDASGATINSYSSAVLASVSHGKGVIEIPASVMASSNVAFLDIKLQKHLVADRSITYRYKVVDYCDDFPIFWQNNLGDFDHFNFGGARVVSHSTKNQLIKKPLESGFSSEDVGLSVVSSRVSSRTKIATAALSSGELVLLENLIKNHSVIYEWQSAGVFLSHVIHAHSKKVEDKVKLINTLAITLRPSNEHIVQLGD